MARLRSSWPLVALILGLFNNVCVRAEDDPCTLRDGDKFYDLRPLKAKDDYKFTSPDGHEFWINVCQPVSGETWALKVDEPEKVGGFTRREHGDFSLGYTNATLTARDGNPTLTMSRGSPCPTHAHMHAATTVHFKCDSSVSGTGEPVLIAQLPPPEDSSCYFFVEWKTNIACATEVRSGAWGFLSVLAAIVGSLLFLYVVAGCLYNYLVLDLRGLDVIRRYSLVSLKDSVSALQTCFARVAGRSSNAFRSSGGLHGVSGGYRGLAVSRDEEQGMLSGPPGFLDDESEDEPEREPDREPERDSADSQGQARGMDRSGVIRL